MADLGPKESSAASTVPENKEAPCNICGRGWPYHHDACAYKHTAIERDRYREALERIYQQGRGPHVEIARQALNV